MTVTTATAPPDTATAPPDTATAGRRALRRTGARGRRWKATPLLVVTTLVALVGATVLAYSPAARWLSELNQAAAVDRYRSDVETADPSAEVQLRRARAYNDALSSGAIVAANTNVPTGRGSSSDPSLDYWKQLRTDSGAMARIQIPAIDVDLPIYHGTSQATLLKGAGHLQGTSLPVGGKGTHSVITAHSGLPEATLFSDLAELDEGDRFTITTFGRIMTYEVEDARVVEPDHTETLGQEAGRDIVTLVTCTPLGINTHRMLVTGKRIAPTPRGARRDAAAGPAGPGFPWFAVAYVASLVAIALYAWWAGRVPPPAASPARGAVPARRRRRRLRRGHGARPEPSASAFDDPFEAAAVLDRAQLVRVLDGATRGAQRNGVAFLFLYLGAPSQQEGPTVPTGAIVASIEAVRAAVGTDAGTVLASFGGAPLVVVHDDADKSVAWADDIAAAARVAASGAPAPTSACHALLVTTDGFHVDAEALVADVEDVARRTPLAPGTAIERVHLQIGIDDPIRDSLHDPVGDPDGPRNREPTLDRPPAPNTSVVAAWLAISDDDYLARLRARRAAAPTSPAAEEVYRP